MSALGAGPGWAGDRGRGEGGLPAVHGGVQTEDRPGGRRLHDAGHRRGVIATGGVVLLPSDDVARGAGAGGAGRRTNFGIRPKSGIAAETRW